MSLSFRAAAAVCAVCLAVSLPVGVGEASASARVDTFRTGPCSWGFVMNPQHNVIWPETNAVFWMTPYVLFPGAEIVVQGSFPEARYMSVKTYGASTIIDSLNDSEILADPGSENPFLDPDAPQDPDHARFTVHVRPGSATGGDDNVLAAFAGDGTAGMGFLSYRVYVPDDPTDVTGGSLPEVTFSLFGGLVKRHLSPCPSALGSGVADSHPSATRPGLPLAPGSAHPDQGTGATPIVFAVNDAAHLFPNPDDAYLVGRANFAAGHVAVVRARGPVFPDTRAGGHVTDPHDVRYWSMCVHMLTWPLPTADCAGDFETTLDADGFYTYVVSLAEDRPSNAVGSEGVTWLPWGRPGIDVALTLRNLLPSGDFTHSIQQIGSRPAAEVMGDYYPQAGMCDKRVFETEGPAACLPPV